MNLSHYKDQLLFYVFVLQIVFSFSQSGNNAEIHKIYDELVGQENTEFYNGPEFIDKYSNAIGDSRYFNRFNFVESSIAYKGQFYAMVPLEYDVFSDNVISKSNDYLSSFIVQLIPEYISSFTIAGHDFVKLTDSELVDDGNGFYEVAYTGNSFKLYIKHRRREKERTIDLAVQHSFSTNNYYLVYYDDTYSIINSIKDFKEVNPDRYEEVRTFRKDNKFLYKSDIDSFMKKLIEYLERH